MKDDGDIKAVIVISESAIEEGNIHDILHEIAHYWLGHHKK